MTTQVEGCDDDDDDDDDVFSVESYYFFFVKIRLMDGCGRKGEKGGGAIRAT